MAVDPRILAMISDPTAGRLGDIGKTIGAKKQQAIENQQKEKSIQMEETIFGLKKSALELEAKKDEVSFMGDSALAMKAYYDGGGDEEGAQALWDATREDAASMGYEMPEKAPNAGMIEGLAAKSKQYINYLNATKANDAAKKWQAIAQIAAIPEKNRTPEQSRMFEALTSPNIAINVPAPTGRTMQVAKNFMKTAKKGDDSLEGEIEGAKGYEDAVSTRAQAIQTEKEKAGKAISLTDAMSQAHKELEHKLIPTDTLTIAGWAPIGKKYVYNPDAELTPEDTGDAIGNPSELKEGESGIYGGQEFRRVDGKLQSRKVE
jgi:hypothetical protein